MNDWTLEQWKQLAERQQMKLARDKCELDHLHLVEVAARRFMREEPNAAADLVEALWALDLWRGRGLEEPGA